MIEKSDPYRAEKLYIILRSAEILKHMVDHPALADDLKALTLPHAPEKRAEEEKG